MKKLPLLSVIFLSITANVWANEAAPIDANFTGQIHEPGHVCMVKRTTHVHTKFTIDHEGKKYSFCCTPCLDRFKAEPDKLRMAIDPVSGKPVDKADALIYAYKGRAVFLESKKSLKKYSKNPDQYPPLD